MRLSPLHPDRKGKKPVTAENERITRLRSALLPVNGAVCLLLTAAYFFAGTGSSSIRPVLYLIPGGMSFGKLFSLYDFADQFLDSHARSYLACPGHDALGGSLGPEESAVRAQGRIETQRSLDFIQIE